MQVIIVFALYGIKSGMLFSIHRDDVKNSNVMWQYFIESKQKIKIPWLFNINMKEELASMYARVSPSTAVNGNGSFKNLTELYLDYFLHTVYLGLSLPTTVGMSVVTNMKEISQKNGF